MAICWCGNTDLIVFSAEYMRCPACKTLVSKLVPHAGKVVDDERDFYGRGYWFGHQEKDLGFPNIVGRARTDLSERCLHWLRCILRFKLPPAHLLELGCAHGGFVALLRSAGYDAMGLEMSPWIVNFARQTFDVPMLLGPIEDQHIEAGALDIIALLDVLEHLPNPVGTMRHCLGLLRSQGALVIQTPSYPEGKTYAEMAACDDPFLEQLKANEHLYLFSPQSIREFFRRLGADYLEFQPPIFFQYDMFLVVSRMPLQYHSEEEIEKALEASPGGRMIQTLLDLDDEKEMIKKNHMELNVSLQVCEADRAARLDVINEQGNRVGELESKRNVLDAELHSLRQQFDLVEADRAARLEVINELQRKYEESEADRNARLEVIQRQAKEFAEKMRELEADRAARLEVINELQRKYEESEADRNARLEVIQRQAKEFAEKMRELEADRAARLEVINELQRKYEESEADRNARLQVIENLSTRLQASEAERTATLHLIEQQTNDLEQVRQNLERMKSSLSWRMTAPFRWLLGR